MLAFLLVVVLCIILLGHAVRSEALLGLVISADRDPFGPEQVRLSAEARDRVVADAPRVRSPRAPAGASVTPSLQRAVISQPTRRAAPHLGSVEGGGLLARGPQPTGPKRHDLTSTIPAHARRDGSHVPPGQARKASLGEADGHARRAHGKAMGHPEGSVTPS